MMNKSETTKSINAVRMSLIEIIKGVILSVLAVPLLRLAIFGLLLLEELLFVRVAFMEWVSLFTMLSGWLRL